MTRFNLNANIIAGLLVLALAVYFVIKLMGLVRLLGQRNMKKEGSKMTISKKDVGYGQYAWYVNGEVTELSEPEIIDLVGKDNEKKFFALWNCYGNFEIEV